MIPEAELLRIVNEILTTLNIGSFEVKVTSYDVLNLLQIYEKSLFLKKW